MFFLSKRLKPEHVAFILLTIYPLTLNFVFGYFSMIFAFALSFFDWDILSPMKFVGLENYAKLAGELVQGFSIMLTDPRLVYLKTPFFNGLRNVLLYTLLVVPTQTLLALVLAVLANQKVRGSHFFRVAYFLPATTCPVIVSLIFIWLFMRDGFVNYFVSAVTGGFRPDWLNDPLFLLPAIAIVAIWGTSAHFSATFLAGLQALPKEVYEAARIDGANALKRFIYITIPLMKPLIVYAVVLGSIGALQMFDLAWVMAGQSGGPGGAGYTVALDIYNTAFLQLRYGYAAAKAVLLFLIVFSLNYYIQEKMKYFRVA
ncbi:carbohydrate ABC transporter permease [Thermofilum pendens]|uniref:Binding-protein-dependent transport systems inner membrane component n=1 Tax=Thermofilum pendens (strain DSM 2475 / Hrk 5) TaxID=368408 RepID=A1RZB9_THEPD|nr:sugar ABC transporter permease [Thermofilum pendens]ABL78549.1 binding-protein-dependent transport systems inner membrane component [Thermofilum pendens Hrk 5]